jgi:heme-degrading monooxygenase HmoA
MTIIRINAITVPEGGGPELERRFANRAGDVDGMEGFEGFELLRPTDGSNRYFVMTRWRDEAAFTGWISSPAFANQHARAASPDGKPVAAHSELLSFEVVSEPDPAR